MLFPRCFPPNYYSNGIEEVLLGFNYTAFPVLTTSDEIQWAILRSRGSRGVDCQQYTEDGGSGFWLLARTRNNDYDNLRPLAPGANMQRGVTLSLFWVATSTVTIVPQPGPPVWTTVLIEDLPLAEQEYFTLAAWPVLRYHLTPEGSADPDSTPAHKPYTGDIGLSDCGCPEIPSGNVPALFQEWGLLSCFLNTCGPWNAPNKVFNPGDPGPPVVSPAWQPWLTPSTTTNPFTSATTQPVLFSWSPPHECTFGSHIPGMQFPDQGCCRLSDATLRWYCPEPPPGFAFLPK